MLPHSERYPGSGTDTHIAEGIGRSGGNPDLQGRNGPAGEFGLDVHTNYVISGDRPVGYPGTLSPLHTLRVTPEFSLGLTRAPELGVYLPLATLDGSGRLT